MPSYSEMEAEGTLRHGDVFELLHPDYPRVIISVKGRPCVSRNTRADLTRWSDSTTGWANRRYRQSFGNYLYNHLIPKGCWRDDFGIIHKEAT